MPLLRSPFVCLFVSNNTTTTWNFAHEAVPCLFTDGSDSRDKPKLYRLQLSVTEVGTEKFDDNSIQVRCRSALSCLLSFCDSYISVGSGTWQRMTEWIKLKTLYFSINVTFVCFSVRRSECEVMSTPNL